ncbi:DUF1801 domain-containing protein [Gammaproteobacteria bacterium]|nr:DUF1801 domain-containing protein [Gammaproteobacteria bacterium]
MIGLAISNKEVAAEFYGYPDDVRTRLLLIRQLIFETASALNGVGDVEETLKWGEPSYCANTGSAIRIDWKKSKPKQCAIYFNCNTKLVATFRELFRDQLCFEGNRAIVLFEGGKVPVNELVRCIELALTYRRIKHLPMLGA